MAALALGAIGAGVGSFFGYASIGWSIGSALGNYLFAPDQPDIEGPRLSDRSVSGSAYGAMRPKLFGTYRMSGEIIWAADLKEYADKEEAGKGGGSGSYTTYTYTATFALALCEGPIAGVRKIWMDNKLVYTAADDADAAQLQVSNTLANGIRVYIGDTAQQPDPVIESYLGSGNVPAYRGTAYLVFNELQVSDYGNRIPQITVEVVRDGQASIAVNTYDNPVTIDIDGGIFWTITTGIEDGVFETLISGNLWTINSDDALYFVKRRLSDGGVVSSKRIQTPYQADFIKDTYAASKPFPTALGEARILISRVDVGGGGVGSASLTWSILFDYQNSNSGGYLNWGNGTVGNLSEYLVTTFYANRQMKFFEDNFYFLEKDQDKLHRFNFAVDKLGNAVCNYEGFVDVVSADNATNGPAIDTTNGDVYVIENPNLVRYDKYLNMIESKAQTDFANYSDITGLAASNGRIWISGTIDGNGTNRVYEFDTAELIASASGSITFDTVASGNIAIKQNGYSSPNISASIFQIYLPQSGQLLSDVVEEICNDVGIDDADIETSDIASDTVRGYLISQQTPARGALEQLSAAYFFDGRESDGVLEFIKRGDFPFVTLDDDDLGCYENDDVQELADAMRVQEEELPRSLTINYANLGRDYQSGAQYSIRQSVLNGTDATIQLPIAFTDDEAKSIVDKMMFSAWENRHKFTLKTWQAFHKLDPADVISARGETLRIISRNEGVNGIIELEAVRELPQIYTGQIGAGAAGPDSGQSVKVPGPTESYLLDIPPLRDMDARNYSHYWAAHGLLDDWPGATLVKFNSDTYTAVATTTSASIAGYATTALGDFDGVNVFDESNTVRVFVNGTLETKTALQVLAGGNAAKLGDEIIGFRTATLVSTGVYDLTGLLRGRLGTDWAMADHAINDQFVMLTTALRNVECQSSDLNIAKLYGAISNGRTLDDASYSSFTYTGNNLKPFSPVNLGGGTTGTGTAWTIRWMRRSRLAWEWIDGVDVDADESAYNFELRIHDNSGTVLRTITVSSATAGEDGRFSTTYSNANQVTDFGEHQKVLYVSVRQIGSYRNSEWTDITQLYSGVPMSVLLLNMQGTNGSTTFTDVYGHTITANGNAQISTAVTGAGDLLLDGSGDYLSTPDSNDWDFGTADFTVEANVMFSSLASTLQTMFSNYNSAFLGWKFEYIASTTNAFRFVNGTNVLATGSFSPSLSQYYHAAACRSAGVLRLFVSGNQIASIADTTNISGSGHALWIGADDVSGPQAYLNGRIKWARITKGRGLYTSNFTPPNAPHLA
jgi:hypothetical protein